MGSIYTGETSKKKLEQLELIIKEKANIDDLLEGGKIKSSILPSYVDDVIEGFLFENTFYLTRNGSADSYSYSDEISASTGKTYLDLETNTQYRFSGTQFINITSGVINDDAIGTLTTYSSKKINTLITNKSEIDDDSNTPNKTLSSQKIKADFQTKSITDTGNYYSSTDIEGVLQEIGAVLEGLEELLEGV